MNSTNEKKINLEKTKIVELCSKLHSEEIKNKVFPEIDKECESYFEDRTQVRLFPSEIFEYHFNTPAELRNALQQMWKYQNCEYMKEFAPVATIATIKNKKDECVETNIPSFIYQF